MIYGQQKNTPPPVQKVLADEPPRRDKLELMLLNANKNEGMENMIDLVRGLIVKFELQYEVIQSDGKSPDYPQAGWFYLKDTLSKGELHLKSFITLDPDTIRMKEEAVKCSRTDYEVLITGATGTGKEIIAKAMIGNREGPIRAINCAGMPEHLVEAELFGYVKGAFTGAETNKAGLFAAAQNGVLFLDEVAELPLHLQSKLLRALQEKTIRRVGGTVEESFNCKVVCASNRNIKKENLKDWSEDRVGTFKKDLYARISTLELHIKSLKDRQCDVEPITLSLKGGKEFLDRYQDELRQGLLDISLNVRSIQQYVIRYATLGRV